MLQQTGAHRAAGTPQPPKIRRSLPFAKSRVARGTSMRHRFQSLVFTIEDNRQLAAEISLAAHSGYNSVWRFCCCYRSVAL